MDLLQHGNYTIEGRVLDKFIDLFAGREDVYAEGIPGGGYSCRHRPLTPEVVRRAFERGIALAFYPLGPDGLTHVFVVDFDSVDHGFDDARRLAKVLRALGIEAYVTQSSRGGHCWITVDRRIPASIGRHAVQVALAEIGLVEGGEVELRPSVDSLANPSQVGRAIRAPLMPNPKTGEQFLLLGADDETPLGYCVEELVAAITRASADRLVDLAGLYQPPDPTPPPGVSSKRRAAGSHGTRRGSVSRVLQDKYGLPAKPGATVHCPFHPDEHESLSTTPDDRRAFCHAPDCWANADGHGRDAFDLLFAHAIIRSIQGTPGGRS